jgi:shikimate dehydrogenase
VTDRYAVFGNPIEHSRSPEIHALFAAQTGQAMSYGRECVPRDGFAEAADAFFAGGGRGLNVTVPFKEDAWRYAARLTERARRAGAVNTLMLAEGGAVLGDTTDGAGLVRDIRGNLAWPVPAVRVLVLGAGGAVRGVLQPLLESVPASLTIANRTPARALALAEAFSDLGTVIGCGFDALPGQVFDLVINGTSASLAGDLPPLPDTLLAEGARCYDMMYAREPTVFMAWASSHGAGAVADGLGMLVEQAAESFHLWRGVRPDTKPVIARVRQSLQSGR